MKCSSGRGIGVRGRVVLKGLLVGHRGKGSFGASGEGQTEWIGRWSRE